MEWDFDALYAKSKRYAREAHRFPTKSTGFALGSAVALELLLKSTLAKISPALVAAPDKDGLNLLHVFGRMPAGVVPHSIVVGQAIERCMIIYPELRVHKQFLSKFFERRNAELHSGTDSYTDYDAGDWMPLYYGALKAVLSAQGLSVDEYLDQEDAEMAEAMLRDRIENAQKQTMTLVQNAKKSIATLSTEELQTRRSSAAVRCALIIEGLAPVRRGVSSILANCPACDSPVPVEGHTMRATEAASNLDTGTMDTRITFLGEELKCVVCLVHLQGYSSLSSVGLGGPYEAVIQEDALRFWAPEDAPSE